MNGPQRYNFEQLKSEINGALLNKDMSTKLYNSTNGIMRIIEAIVKTKGENWAVQVLDKDGTPVLTPQEQQKFTEAFQPYVETIIDFFGQPDEMRGGDGLYPGADFVSKLSGLSLNNINSKKAQVTGQTTQDDTPSINSTYLKVIDKVGNINSTVNDYSSKY